MVGVIIDDVVSYAMVVILHRINYYIRYSVTRPFKAVGIIIEAVLNLPGSKVALLEVCIAVMGDGMCILVQTARTVCRNNNVKLMTCRSRTFHCRSAHVIRYTVAVPWNESATVAQRLQLRPCNACHVAKFIQFRLVAGAHLSACRCCSLCFAKGPEQVFRCRVGIVSCTAFISTVTSLIHQIHSSLSTVSIITMVAAESHNLCSITLCSFWIKVAVQHVECATVHWLAVVGVVTAQWQYALPHYHVVLQVNACIISLPVQRIDETLHATHRYHVIHVPHAIYEVAELLFRGVCPRPEVILQCIPAYLCHVILF